MHRHVLAAAFILCLASPALAADQFYVALDTTTNQCQVVNQMPDGTNMRQIGTAYGSQAEAQQAITTLPECNA
jgi:hypothetical protein